LYGCGDCTAACPEAAIRIKRGFNAGFLLPQVISAAGVNFAEKILIESEGEFH
jgi:ferredoxin